MVFPDPALRALAFKTAPPLDPAWLTYEAQLPPPRTFASVQERQPIYAQECRDLHAKMMAPGMRDHTLSRGIVKREFTLPSRDGFPIPVLQLDLEESQNEEPDVVVIYYHGGGLKVGEADSEELSCRHILNSGIPRIRLYSIGYRLLPQHPAQTILTDCLTAFNALHSTTARTIIAGSSSGGQLATAVSQAAPRGSVAGVLLRCPVTADRPSGEVYVPEKLREWHTSVSPSFTSSLNGYLQREVPRDGLERLPLEATEEELAGLPRTWVQLCSNDTIYSDGLCYAMLLREAGVDVEVVLEKGWPHTFWLKAPELQQSFEAEKRMVDGLKWLLQW